jgi:UDP-glucuronate decarboxylase
MDQDIQYKTVLMDDMEYIARNYPDMGAFDGKTILITGFAGFLGYYFTHFFMTAVERGIDIKSLVLVDNFVIKRPRWISELAAKTNKVKIHTFDVASDQIEDLALKYDPDFIVHMASIASPTHYRRWPIETVDANVWGLRRLLDYARTLPLDGFLFFSSSEIYGDPPSEAIPTPEHYRGHVGCVGPRACYDEAKRFGETLCYIFANRFDMPISIVRPFNNFGPGMSINDRRAPADFARAVVHGEDIVLYSDGGPTRTFCYVADAIVGYLTALPYGEFDCFNIGSDHPEIIIGKFAEMFRDIGNETLGYPGRVTFATPPESDYLTDNPSRRCPDITKARRLLGFEPSVPLEEGVRRFLTHVAGEESP